MASFWIRVNARLADDASVRAFARALLPTMPSWQSVPLACGLLVALWGAVADEQEDGDLSARDDDALEEWARWRGEPGQFATLFLATFTEGGRIKLWEEYQGPLIERRRRDRDRIAARRALSRQGDPGPRPGDAHADTPARRVDKPDCPGDTVGGAVRQTPAEVGATARRGDRPPDIGATRADVGATLADVREMSTSNENGNGNGTTKSPLAPRAREGVIGSVGGGLAEPTRAAAIESAYVLGSMLTPDEMDDVRAFLATRPAEKWDRWWAELLRLVGPSTGAIGADLATACRDALLAEPPVGNAMVLSTFVTKRRDLRMAEARPKLAARGGGRAAPAPAPYTTAGNEVARRRLEREED